jgi:hypothetical protein
MKTSVYFRHRKVAMTMHAEQPHLPRLPDFSREHIMHFTGPLAVAISLAMVIPDIPDKTAWSIGVALCGFVLTYLTSKRAGKAGAEKAMGETKAIVSSNETDIAQLRQRLASSEADNATLRQACANLQEQVSQLTTQVANLQLGNPHD